MTKLILFQLKKELSSLVDPKQAKVLQKFFKTGPGEYGEGDIFLGIKVPLQREVANKYIQLSFDNIENLLKSKIHEYRLIGLLILISKYKIAKEKEREKIFNFYLKNYQGINNWDLVDMSAPYIVGDYLLNRNKDILYKLARSKNLWKKRIAIVSTFTFIKNNKFNDVLKISELLLNDNHDLIHKAVGWMLRELGKRNQKIEEDFLKKYIKKMPRTMLRYAIEKFEEKKRKSYLAK